MIRRSWRRYAIGGLLVLLLLAAVEAYRAYTFYGDLNSARDSLLSLKDDLELGSLNQTEAEVQAKQDRLRAATSDLESARSFVDSDPLLAVAGVVPVLGKQTRGLQDLVRAADEAAQAGVEATDVAIAFARYERQPDETAILAALRFIDSQEATMASVSQRMDRLRQLQSDIPDGLRGPMANAKTDLDEALDKLDGLVSGYERASNFLPGILGYESRKSYLLLPQNNTELFPSGGLMSSYGVATFENGSLTSIELEYFGDLYDRWQRTSNREYIEPPAPLRNYLKQGFSWALGEAGWFPDFPTSAGLARTFTGKGGVPDTDGVIALDMHFMKGLLRQTGPVPLPAFGVTVTAENFDELSLELTRTEDYANDTRRSDSHRAFLSELAGSLISRIFTTPKEQWIDLLAFLDAMGKERHLQLSFNDERLQSLSTAYGFDGAIVQPESGDYFLLADTSVNSTKLNLILEPAIRLDSTVRNDGTVRTLVTYEIHNPFPQWRVGRDPGLVEALMIQGVYGSFSRVYTPAGSRLVDVRVDGARIGVEQNGEELGKQTFGRFFRVLPGATATMQMLYETPPVVEELDGGRLRYILYVQKQAGTAAVPFLLSLQLPAHTAALSITVDGQAVDDLSRVETDLQTDREIEVIFAPQ